MMPAGADPRLVQFLSNTLIEAINSQETVDNLYRLGMFPLPMNAEEVTAEVRRQEAIAATLIDLMFGQ
jgi:tripartite-type tricarboxylate transporter receptor subunit TctC